VTCEVDGKAVGFCYAVPEEFTDRAWNMLALAVLPLLQDKGHGGAPVSQLETTLKGCGQRVLIADTAGVDTFAQLREFYRKNGHTKEAHTRDLWAAGDDKIVFWKSLASVGLNTALARVMRGPVAFWRTSANVCPVRIGDALPLFRCDADE
jgi:ribosomal protein S18 acetylase RimI-like enzyme